MNAELEGGGKDTKKAREPSTNLCAPESCSAQRSQM